MKKTPRQMRDTSPRASGPAGSQFEAKVATHYALAVLAQTEAFGLPGAIVDRLEFQRSGQGHPLDDIIIKGTSQAGDRCCLEVQAKRSISFTKGNDNFASIVADIIESRKTDPARRFAVAIERTSGPIENGVQETLELSRHSTDADTFLMLLGTPGRGNPDMRNFVDAFKKHLADNDQTDENTLFEILKSLSVLTFDYARPHSIAEHHDRLRARRLASHTGQGNPYDVLFGWMLRSDAIGGETDRAHLIKSLREQGVEISRAPNLAGARARIEEMSRFALSEIKTTVCGQQLVRADRRQHLEELLIEAQDGSGVIEITGPGGAGKSGLLKAIAEGRQMSARIVVLAPDRTPSGGWPALRSDFDIDATAEEFFQDLSCDGGGLICIDGLDRFREEGQRKTMIDVVSTALGVKGVTVLFTARSGWEKEATISFGEELMASLSTKRQLLVEGLDDNEAKALAEAAPTLAPLLRPDHPAKALARNPFILRRLASTRLNTEKVLSEAELAWDWWTSGAHSTSMTDGDIHVRRRVLLDMAQGLLSGETVVDVSKQDPAAVETLIRDGVLNQVSTDRVKFQHDLFTDWAIACTLSEDPQRIKGLALNEQPPFWLSRGFELACRQVAEGDDNDAWPNIIKDLEGNGVKSGWTGIALLALIRSEHANSLLERYTDTLLQEKGDLAAKLIRRVVASHGQSAEKILKDILPTGATIPKGLIMPVGPLWLQLITWCIAKFDQLPPKALSATISLFEGWLTLAAFGENTISPLLLDRLTDVLVTRIEEHDRPLPRPGEPLPTIKYAVSRDALETARLQIALFAHTSPSAAVRYLTAIAESKDSIREMLQLLEFPGRFPSAAPAAFSLAFQSVIKEETEEERSPHKQYHHKPFSISLLDGPFVLGRCGIDLFTDLLNADRSQGIELIRNLVRTSESAIDSVNEFSLMLSGCERRVFPIFSYGWSRGQATSNMAFKALEALEYWAHQRIESGESLDDVINQIVRVDSISGAILLVIVDLVLGHSSLNGQILTDLLASPELLALDSSRAQYDIADKMSGGKLRQAWRGKHSADTSVEEDLSGRVSRTLALHDVIPQVVFHQPEKITTNLRNRLAEGVTRLGEWTEDTVILTSPVFMASHAFRLTSKENYDLVTQSDDESGEQRGWSYRWPEAQFQWLQDQSSESSVENESFNRSLTVRMAMDNETNSITSVSIEDAEAVLAETADASPQDEDGHHEPKDPWLNRVAATAFIARVGPDQVIEPHRDIITTVFAQALKQSVRESHNIKYDVMYDAQALAITGLLYLTSRFQHTDDRRTLLNAVSNYSASAVSAFSHHHKAAKNLGDKLLRAIIRIGLQSCIFSRHKHYDEEEAEFDTRQSKLSELQSTRMMAELEWIEHEGIEPTWPSPPPRRRRSKRTITLPGGKSESSYPRHRIERPDFYFDDRTAAVWLQTFSQHSNAVVALLETNRDWLIDTNSPGEDGEDDNDFERTWTRELMECAAIQAKSWTDEERNKLIFDVLKEFTDEAFIDAAAAFLVKSDLVHIEGDAADTTYLVDIRQWLWTRLKKTLRWQQHLWSPRDGMEIHLKELIAAFFFKLSYGFGNDTAYTKGLVEDQITPFLSLLTEIAVASAPCPTIAHLFLDVLELIESKKAEPFLVVVANSWATTGDQHFWNELGIGKRACAIAEKTDIKSSAQQWADIADVIAATGVVAGEMLKQRIRESP